MRYDAPLLIHSRTLLLGHFPPLGLSGYLEKSDGRICQNKRETVREEAQDPFHGC